MRNQKQQASVLLARLLGADFDTLLEELDESLERSERELEKPRNKLARLKAQPDITVEGEVPSLEEIEEMIAESERKEALAAEREAARQREAEQEAERKKKREEERKRRESLERIRAQEAERQRRREAINEAWNPTRKSSPFVPREAAKEEPENGNDDYGMEF